MSIPLTRHANTISSVLRGEAPTNYPPIGMGEGHRFRWKLSLPSEISTIFALEGLRLGNEPMTMTTFTDLITDESQLCEVFGWPSDRALNKQSDRRELPSLAEILRDHAALGECDLDELQRELDHRVKSTLH